MKTKIWISFNALPIPGGAATILEPARCGNDVADVNDVPILNQIFVHVKLDEYDERVAKLLTLLEKHGVEVDASTYVEYSEEDRQSARLLLMSADIKNSFHVSLRGGTKYDMSAACANCGAGAVQPSVLYVDGDYLSRIRKHRAIGSWQGHILVDGGMVKKLKDARITGISFGDVRARLRNDKWTSVARDQILIEHTMPPMRGELTADDEKYLCKVCRRGGRMDFPKQPYREEDLAGMQDFNLTWEWFGEFWPEDKQRGEKRPSPYVLVTPKVMNIFREAGVKTFEWTPVGIER
ncbi:MAG: hypothetical protein IPM54_25835 [Polyangiaceae bacterium]|nr:hypothetical protein [Polyangiaceae bacterium]